MPRGNTMKKVLILISIYILSLTAACSSEAAPETEKAPQPETSITAPGTQEPSPDSTPEAQSPDVEPVWYSEGFVIPEDRINILPDISLIPEKEINPESYLIRNESDQVIWFGANDRIELKSSDGWKRIATMAEAPAIGFMLEPGQEEKFWISRDNRIDMVDGSYRVIMEFNLTETDITGKDRPGDEAYYLSAEFEIRD